MANEFDNLIPDLFTAADVVSRELVGMIPAATRDATADRVAVGQTVRSSVAPAVASRDIVAAMTPPDDGDVSVDNKTIQITKSKAVPFNITGEEEAGLNNNGAGELTIRQGEIAQAFRVLTNEIEADGVALATQASRAYGAAGVTPFVSDLTDTAQLAKILDDNGAPVFDRQFVMNTSASANLKSKVPTLINVNQSGETSMLRQGILSDVHGFDMRQSGQFRPVAVGDAASATTDTTGYAIGSTTITLASAGTGAILAGDIVTFAGDSEKYVVATGNADVSAGGTIVLQKPGLREAIATSATNITVVGESVRNLAFSRSAVMLAQRLPYLPGGKDMANERVQVRDPHSGITFDFAMYAGYHKVHYEISCAWGWAAFKNEHMATLLG